MITHAGEVTLLKLGCVCFSERVYSERKKNAPGGRGKVVSFKNRLLFRRVSRKANKNRQKFSLVKMAENLSNVSIPHKINTLQQATF